jgi:CRISPR system Cascade subunit CasA
MTTNVSSFSLIDHRWILVLDRAARVRPVGLRELFTQASDLKALAGDLPTEVFAILRLLLAILHRAAGGPPDERAWHQLWRSPRLPVDEIGEYLDAFADRFDLLHPATPFYQVAALHTARNEILGLERLIADVPNGFAYLTSRLGESLRRISPAEAARWVVHCQAYDTSGIKSGAVGDERVVSGRGYPIGVGPCGALGGVFLEGATLRETLLLNLLPNDVPHRQSTLDDLPMWERAPHDAAEEPVDTRGPYGVLGLYTWQSRRIRLFGDEDAITGVLIANGDKLTLDNRQHLEPMTAWRRNPGREKQLKQPTVYTPARHDHTRALWRGLAALLPVPRDTQGGGKPPPVVAPPLMQWLARLRTAGYLDPSYRVTTRAVGMVYGTQQSVVDEIYSDAVTMTVQAFDPASALPAVIVDSARDAEATVRALRTLAANLARAAGARGDAPSDAGARAAEVGYAALDPLFRRWLSTLGPHSQPTPARAAWQQLAQRVVGQIGAELVEQVGPAAWAGREVTTAGKGAGESVFLSSPLADLWFRRAVGRALPLAGIGQPGSDRPVCQEVPA